MASKFSVKTHLYKTRTSRRPGAFDGPWKPTLEAAIEGYVEKLRSKGLGHEIVFRPFVAEEGNEATAACSDGQKPYNERPDLFRALVAGLKDAGLTLGDPNP